MRRNAVDTAGWEIWNEQNSRVCIYELDLLLLQANSPFSTLLTSYFTDTIASKCVEENGLNFLFAIRFCCAEYIMIRWCRCKWSKHMQLLWRLNKGLSGYAKTNGVLHFSTTVKELWLVHSTEGAVLGWSPSAESELSDANPRTIYKLSSLAYTGNQGFDYSKI